MSKNLIQTIFKRKKNNKNNMLQINGKNNNIILITKDGVKRLYYNPNLTIKIIGNNNTISIDETAKVFGQIYIDADNTNIHIGKETYCNMCLVCDKGNNQNFSLGDYSTIGYADFKLNEENAAIIIGKHCMFSSHICILATDAHAIMNSKDKQIINFIKGPITIGDHCWVGYDVKMTKNARLPDWTIVGTGSVVTKEFLEKNTIIAGNPAKIIKKNVIWDIQNLSLLEAVVNK